MHDLHKKFIAFLLAVAIYISTIMLIVAEEKEKLIECKNELIKMSEK